MHAGSIASQLPRTRADFRHDAGLGEWVAIRDVQLVQPAANQLAGVELLKHQLCGQKGSNAGCVVGVGIDDNVRVTEAISVLARGLKIQSNHVWRKRLKRVQT